jgi:lipid A 3-O-deacylase
VVGGLALVLLAGVAFAQAPALQAKTNPVGQDEKPFHFGVMTQGGFGVTEERDSFHFFMAGVNAGKVLTPTVGKGILRGNFELGVEFFPLWQSYTPVMQRQNCVPVSSGSKTFMCSGYFNVGGTFTGLSITPDVMRWNFAGTPHWSPWIQGAGGLVWTNHKYPAFGGPPAYPPGSIVQTPGSSIGNNGSNDNTSVWNFTPQFGVGTHYFVRQNRSFDFGANAIHISSASLGDKNPGVNASVQFTLGYSWWK